MRIVIGAMAIAAAIAGTAIARERPVVPQGQPQAFEALMKCRAIADNAARLRCFDEAAASLQQAAARRDIVIVDRAQMRQTRRTLFGLEIPRLPFFGRGDDEKSEEVSSIEGVIASASQGGDGRWVVRLEDGSIWGQVDDTPIAAWPKRGNKVVVQRGALGSYMMRVNGQPGVRVKRRV